MRTIAKLGILIMFIIGVSACMMVPSPEDTIQPPGQEKRPPNTSGADAGGESQSDDAPGGAADVERRILDKLPAKATVTAPKQPEGAKSVQLADIDGDGIDEALTVYAASDNPQQLNAAVFKENEEEWSIIWETEGSGYELDYAGFADITGDGQPEILLGWAFGASVGNGLDIYTWQNGEISLLAQQGYHRIEVENLHDQQDQHPGHEIAIWTKDTGIAYAVEVYKWEPSGLVPAAEVYPQYFPRVEAYYQELLQEAPEAPILWYYLADAEWKSGKAEEALQSIEKARSLDTDRMLNEKLDGLKEKIEGNKP